MVADDPMLSRNPSLLRGPNTICTCGHVCSAHQMNDPGYCMTCTTCKGFQDSGLVQDPPDYVRKRLHSGESLTFSTVVHVSKWKMALNIINPWYRGNVWATQTLFVERIDVTEGWPAVQVGFTDISRRTKR